MKSPKPVSAATRALLDEMKQDAEPTQSKLNAASAALILLRDKEYEVAQLKERVKTLTEEINEIKGKTLVDIFDDAGVTSLGLPPIGNMPPFEVEIIDYYHANIKEENQPKAFAYLDKRGLGDLIKSSFTVAFGLKESKQADRFKRSLEKAGIEYSLKQGVPWNTLTSWFKADHKKKPLTPKVMELLGATTGRVAKVIEPKKERS
jgi:hypothetical protein